MAFGFISDVFETVGDVVLGPKGGGQRTGKVAQIGATVAGAPPEVAAFAGKVGQAYAGGGKGQGAASTPTFNQAAVYAPESGLSGVGTGPITQRDYDNIYTGRQIITGGLPAQIGTGTAIGTAVGTAMDLIPDIEISKFFGNGCQKALPRLVGMTKDGCPTVTRKQQRVLRNMAQYMPLESVAYEAGVSVTDMARLISKTFPPRSKGISGAQLRTANRVNNKILNMAHKLGYDCKPMTTTKRGCK